MSANVLVAPVFHVVFWGTDFVARKLVIDQCLVNKQPVKTEAFKVGKQFAVLKTV
jgi:hypothetical protein